MYIYVFVLTTKRNISIFLLYAPRVKAHPRGSGQPRGHSRPQVVNPGSSRPNEESIQPSAHSRKAGGGTLIPAPKAHADAQRPCVQPRTQFGNPSTPIGSQGPFQAGGQAPPIHQVTKSRQGEFNGIPGHSLACPAAPKQPNAAGNATHRSNSKKGLHSMLSLH